MSEMPEPVESWSEWYGAARQDAWLAELERPQPIDQRFVNPLAGLAEWESCAPHALRSEQAARWVRCLEQPLHERTRRLRDASDRSKAEPVSEAMTGLREHGPDFLRDTDGAHHELVAWLCKRHGDVGALQWHTLWRALADQNMQAHGARHRWEHAAHVWQKLGMGRELGARVQRVAARRTLSTWATVRVAPSRWEKTNARIAPAGLDHGPLSDLAAAHDVARAVMLALAVADERQAALVLWARQTPRAAGMLVMQLEADEGFLQRTRIASPQQLSAARLHSAIALLCMTRLQVQLVLCSDGQGFANVRQAEALHTALRTTLGVEIPMLLMPLFLDRPALMAERAWSALCGLALHAGLRARYDADWYRNPRAEETLRGAGMRSETLAASAWCAELGVGVADAAKRLMELV